MQEWPDLGRTLSGLRWAIVGAVAARYYMPERATRDLDIAVATSDIAEATKRLVEAGFQKQGELSIGGSSWLAPDGTPLDVIEAREGWWPAAFEAAAQNQDSRSQPVLTAPYLVLMKLSASRTQDVADVSRILGGLSEPELENVREVIKAHASEDLADLESLIVLGKLEHEN